MQTPIDTVVVVDRSSHPAYPPFVKRIIVPELEHAGPPQYDIASDLTVLSCEVSPPYKILSAGMAADNMIKSGYITACLGIQDGIAIQTKGIEWFRALKRVFQLHEIHLWRSIAADGAQLEAEILFGRPETYLPTLIEKDGEVVIEWKKFSDCQWFKWVDIVYFTALLPKKVRT